MLLQACRIATEPDAPPAANAVAGGGNHGFDAAGISVTAVEHPGFLGQVGGRCRHHSWLLRWWQDWTSCQSAADCPEFPAPSYWEECASKACAPPRPRDFNALGPADELPEGSRLSLEFAQLMPGRVDAWQRFLQRYWVPAALEGPGILAWGHARHRKLAGQRLLWSLWLPDREITGLARLLHPGYRMPGGRLQLLRKLQIHRPTLQTAFARAATHPSPPAL